MDKTVTNHRLPLGITEAFDRTSQMFWLHFGSSRIWCGTSTLLQHSSCLRFPAFISFGRARSHFLEKVALAPFLRRSPSCRREYCANRHFISHFTLFKLYFWFWKQSIQV